MIRTGLMALALAATLLSGWHNNRKGLFPKETPAYPNVRDQIDPHCEDKAISYMRLKSLKVPADVAREVIGRVYTCAWDEKDLNGLQIANMHVKLLIVTYVNRKPASLSAVLTWDITKASNPDEMNFLAADFAAKFAKLRDYFTKKYGNFLSSPMRLEGENKDIFVTDLTWQKPWMKVRLTPSLIVNQFATSEHNKFVFTSVLVDIENRSLMSTATKMLWRLDLGFHW